MSASFAPAHVLSLAHSTTDQSIDRAFDGTGRNPTASFSPLAVVDDPRFILLKVGFEVAQVADRHSSGSLGIRQFVSDSIQHSMKNLSCFASRNGLGVDMTTRSNAMSSRSDHEHNGKCVAFNGELSVDLSLTYVEIRFLRSPHVRNLCAREHRDVRPIFLGFRERAATDCR